MWKGSDEKIKSMKNSAPKMAGWLDKKSKIVSDEEGQKDECGGEMV